MSSLCSQEELAMFAATSQLRLVEAVGHLCCHNDLLLHGEKSNKLTQYLGQIEYSKDELIQPDSSFRKNSAWLPELASQ